MERYGKSGLASLLLAAILTTAARAQACGVPPGTIIAYAGETIPAGWLVADGRPLRQSDYPSLYDAIRSAHGAGLDESGIKVGDFNLPDLRGRFLRGVDLSQTGVSTGRDPDATSRQAPRRNTGNSGNKVGSVQEDGMQRHKHEDAGHTHRIANYRYRQTHDRTPRPFGILDNTPGSDTPTTIGKAVLGDPVDSGSGAPRLSTETRPKNVAVYFLICAN
jgi:microcystin-dependent protein